MKRLTVLYDAHCGLCFRAREWMLGQPAYLTLEFIPAASALSSARFPGLEKPGSPEELILVDDAGGVYRGGDAWVMCLYALRDFREWSIRLARPSLLPLARSAFQLLSKNRLALSRFMNLASDLPLQRRLQMATPPTCDLSGARS